MRLQKTTKEARVYTNERFLVQNIYPFVQENHPFAEEVRRIVYDNMGRTASPEMLINELLAAMDKAKMLYYADPGRIGLLNSHGRVLVAVLEDPHITQRALSKYLNVSESNINYSLRQLVKDGLIEKIKVKNRNHYRFNADAGIKHPDIRRFIQNLLPLIAASQAKTQTLHQPQGSPTPDTTQDH